VKTARLFLLICTLLLGAACSRQPEQVSFVNTDITGLGYARDFSLTDHNGEVRTLADFKGKAVVVFFGYTQCPDVCPTTLLEMAAAMKELGPLADKVQVLFITLDPERDTPQLLAQYVPNFHPSFIGLSGDAAAVDAAAKEFRVYHQKVLGSQPDTYTVDHFAGSYIFDPQGKVRVFVPYGKKAGDIAHDLKALIT
jgi:protein SCO1/2